MIVLISIENFIRFEFHSDFLMLEIIIEVLRYEINNAKRKQKNFLGQFIKNACQP